MDDEIVIILVPKRQQKAAEDGSTDEAIGIRREFSGPDRFKKARKLINALDTLED